MNINYAFLFLILVNGLLGITYKILITEIEILVAIVDVSKLFFKIFYCTILTTNNKKLENQCHENVKTFLKQL